MTASEWTSQERALAYLARADAIPHRTEGEAALLDLVSPTARRVLDLGSGDGRLLALVLLKCPGVRGVALDISPPMLQAAGERFVGHGRDTFVAHDLDDPLPDLGPFDAIVSSFAIHHCSAHRTRALYAEVLALLDPGGVFANLEHVTSPTPAVHGRFLDAVGMTPEDDDPSNHYLDVETHLRWLREIGFVDADCYWKWLEYALLAGARPAGSA